MATRARRFLAGFFFGLFASTAVLAQCPGTTPAQGAVPPGPLPLFPSNNWWNVDIRSAPVDAGSAGYISFINNGGTRKLRPDFGGEESPGSTAIYGFPYAVVDGNEPKVSVNFQYPQESDGVDHATGQPYPFYPIPVEAVTQPHWVEGGAPGNVDQRNSGDRHIIVIDCTNKYLYELYNAYYSSSQGRWLAYSGAFFDMKTNGRRPDGWTSADAAGLAIFPGLVRYDEVYNAAVPEIKHALRVTVRATNGYVYPASHKAGSTAGALPMGARLRLKTSVGGKDPALRTSNANVQKIFRAMQKYGLIVADNGSDMFVSGTFDKRWDNGVLNPAFALLTASDFEVVKLGWKPATGAPALATLAASPNPVTGGKPATGTVTLSAAAPSGGATVTLKTSNAVASVPSSVAVAQGATSATFSIPTSAVTSTQSATITATYAGVSKTVSLSISPAAAPAPALTSLGITPTSVVGGSNATGKVTLSAKAPAAGTRVSLSSLSTLATPPSSALVPAGASSVSFTITTTVPWRAQSSVPITATLGSVSKSATLTVTRP